MLWKSFTRAHGACAIIAITWLISCSKEETKSTLCLPTGVVFSPLGQPGGDSVAYKYDSQDRLIQMAYYGVYGDSYFLWKSTEVSYSVAGNPDTVRLRVLLNTGAEETAQRVTYALSYDDKGQANQARIFSYPDLLPNGQLSFVHDGQGRLINKAYEGSNPLSNFQYSFQYNSQGNLVSYTYEDATGSFTGRTNNAFDSHPQFFSASPALTLINLYLTSNNDPGSNNPITSTVYKIGGIHYLNGLPFNFSYTYNDRGWPLTVTDQDATNISDRRYYYKCP